MFGLGWLFGRRGCSHRETTEAQTRFEIVNAQRRTIVGWFESRKVCERCGASLSTWEPGSFEDFSDSNFEPELLAELLKNGELTIPFEAESVREPQ